jgi:fibronectin-binding autotransporter adhesin
MKKGVVFCVVLLVGLLAGLPAWATTYTWVGNSNNNWSTSQNWSGGPGAPPGDTDSLIFSGTANTSTTNDLTAGTDIAGIAFANTADGESFTLSGNAIDLTGSISTADNDSNNSVGQSDTIALDIQLTGGDRAFDVGGLDGNDRHDLLITGVISEDGSARRLLTAGGGYLYLSGTNTYTGGTVIGDGSNAGGALEISNNEALGAGSISINGNKLRLNNVTIDEAITYDAYAGGGAITGAGASNTLTGTVTLNESCDVRGNNIRWSGGIVSTANKGISINGSKHTINTTPVDLGTGGFNVTSAGNNPANATMLNVGSNTWGSTILNWGGYLTLGLDDALPATAPLTFAHDYHTVARSGTLDLNGHSQTVASLATTASAVGKDGTRRITGGGTLTVDQVNTTEFDGVISDGSTATAITKSNSGTLTMSGASTYSGATTINGGALQVAGGAIGSRSAVMVYSGAVLRLDGDSVRIGSLAGAGTVENSGVVEPLIDNDFSNGSVVLTGGRFREDDIDQGWRTRGTVGGEYVSEWTITNGTMQNAATTSGTHYDACPAESSVVQVRPNTLGGPAIRLSFDYSVPDGDILYAHFWGYTNSCDLDSDIMGNVDTCNGYYSNDEHFTELDSFNFKDGATTGFGGPDSAVSGALTNSGSYSTNILIANLGITGIVSVADFSYISLAFNRHEDGLTGTTWVDNVSITIDETTLTVGSDNTATTFSGLVQEGVGGGTMGLMKTGTNVIALVGTNNYTGSITVSGGTLEIGGSWLSATNAEVNIYNGSTLRIACTGEDISVESLSSDGVAGNTLAFKMNADGVSALNVLGGSCSLEDFALTVDGSGYSGDVTDIVLIDAADLQSLSTNVTVTGFDPGRYLTTLVQDQVADEVRLLVEGSGILLIVR